jgi:hypothetical protein
MQNKHLSNPFFFPKRFNSLGEFLLKFSENSPFSVCVKDLYTKKVSMHNLICSTFWGFNEKGMAGMNAREILTNVTGFTNVEKELQNIEYHEYEAVKNNYQSLFTQTLLSYSGFAQIRQSIIIPLYGIHNKPVSTIGIALDLTQHVNLLYLLDVYKYYYPNKTQTVERMMTYLNITHYFHKALCYEELRTLLSMVQDPRHKQVASLLSISPKTVSSYLCAIRDKLQPGIDLHSVLVYLRTHQQCPIHQ